MNKEKIEYYAHLTTAAIGAALLLFVVIRYGLALLLPFIIAWCVANAVRPLAEKISSVTKLPTKATGAALCVIIVLLLIGAFVGIVSYVLGEAWSFVGELTSSGVLESFIQRLVSVFSEGEGNGELSSYISGIIDGALSKLLSSLGSLLTSLASGLPRVLIFILVSVVATLYFSLDLERINKFISDIMPKSLHGWISRNKKRIFHSFLKYLRAYLFLMLITFCEMVIGFLFLRLDYAVLLALIVAVLDALPLIGVGVILLPIALYNFISGNGAIALGLVIIFAVHTVIRQLIEPRIVGKNLGIHPVLSLFLLYLGYSLFGAVGIFLLPFASVLLNVIINKDDSSEVA